VPGPAWGGHAAAKPPIAAAQQPATAKRQTAALPAAIDDHSGLLWDYGAPAPETRPAPAPAPPRQPTSNGATPFPTLSPVDAQPPTKSKKKKGKAEEAPSPANNGRREPADEGETFDLDGGQMPPSMARWCKEQMMALTGNDDTTLTQFLFTLQNDGEVESYLSVYLGDSPAVASFAKEFALQKRAARGMGASREWQTAKPRSKQPSAQQGGEESEAAKAAKRKNKKKVVDPALLGFSVESSRIMQGEIQFVEGM